VRLGECFLAQWKLFTREVSRDGCSSKIIAEGKSHPGDVEAVPPLVLPVDVDHHLKNRSNSATLRGSLNIKTWAAGSSQFCVPKSRFTEF